MRTKTFNRRNSDWLAHGQVYGQPVSRYSRIAARLNNNQPRTANASATRKAATK